MTIKLPPMPQIEHPFSDELHLQLYGHLPVSDTVTSLIAVVGPDTPREDGSNFSTESKLYMGELLASGSADITLHYVPTTFSLYEGTGEAAMLGACTSRLLIPQGDPRDWLPTSLASHYDALIGNGPAQLPHAKYPELAGPLLEEFNRYGRCAYSWRKLTGSNPSVDHRLLWRRTTTLRVADDWRTITVTR